MESSEARATTTIFRNLPSVDELLRSATAENIVSETGSRHAASLAREVIDQLRLEIQQEVIEDRSEENLMALAGSRLENAWLSQQKTRLQRVINATGVIIHTNFGRAPLSEAAKKAVFDQASGYCTLEYDLETGRRGRRGSRAEAFLVELTGAESALIVNNCAAAAFFVLTVFAAGGEVVISRGELVEIGGDFRVPDVLAQSGASLREVGTTNRTKLADYEKAVNENTRMILRVHPSNYRIVGFTAMPSLAELADLAHRHDVLLYEDLGSGALIDLSAFGLNDEPVVGRSIAAEADVVTFSGDKLLGSSQAGIIVGKHEIIDRLRKHPLYRALRVDKLALAALEASLEAYRRETALQDIPVLRMISMTKDEIAARVGRFAERLNKSLGEDHDLRVEIIDGVSAIGGGAAPAVQPETKLLALNHRQMPAVRLEQLLRNSAPPIIARIVDDKVLIDLRTVSENEELELSEILSRID